MAYRTGSATSTHDMLEQLKAFLTTANNYHEITYAGTGDGELTSYSAIDLAPTEDWVLTCTSAGPSATFSVEGSVSGVKADATSAVAYDNSIIAFTITDGTAAWAIDDTISFRLYKNMADGTPWTCTIDDRGPAELVQTSNDKTWIIEGTEGFLHTEGKFSEELGLRCNGRGVIYNPDITSQIVDPAVIESYPSQFSVSYWVKRVTVKYDNVDVSYPYSKVNGWIAIQARASDASLYGYSVHNDNTVFGGGYLGSTTTVNRNTSYNASTVPSTKPFSIEEWQHVIITHDSTVTDGSATLYLDGTLVKSVSGWATTADQFRALFYMMFGGPQTFVGHGLGEQSGWVGDISDFIMWDKILDQTDATALATAVVPTPSTTPNVFWKLNVHDDNVSIIKRLAFHTIDASNNESAFNLEHTCQADVANHTSINYSLRLQSIPFGGAWVNPDQHLRETYTYSFGKTNYQSYHRDLFGLGDSASWPMYMAVRPPNKPIAKYWFMADDKGVTLNYKIYDPTAPNQKNPVYQTGYAGRLNTYGGVVGSFVCIGTKNTWVDWESTDTTFSSGFNETDNNIMLHGNGGWQCIPPDTVTISAGLSTTRKTLLPIPFYTPKYYAHKYIYDSGVSYMYSDFASLIGETHVIFKMDTTGVSSEDIVTVGADDYLVLQDTHNSANEQFLAIKLV